MASQSINLKSRLLNPYVVLAVWVLCTLQICISLSLAAPASYNNFLVFRGVFDHLFSSLPLYEAYPLEYGDLNHYGPVFGFIIAPFAVLPMWLGLSLWCMCLSLSLYWAVRRLPLPVVLTTLILWLTLNDFYGACFKQQFNIAVAALVVGAFVMIEKRREGWAALFIVIGTFVKIYGIVGLAFFFFARRKWRFIGYMALWSAVALLLPLLFVSPEYLWAQYQAWYVDIAQKNAEKSGSDCDREECIKGPAFDGFLLLQWFRILRQLPMFHLLSAGMPRRSFKFSRDADHRPRHADVPGFVPAYRAI